MLIFVIAACEELTELPEIARSNNQQSLGSLRNPDDERLYKIHLQKQERLRERDPHFDDVSSSSLGILIKQAPMQHLSHKPPGYNTRYVGKSITHHTAIHDTVFRPPGPPRRDDTWVHQGITAVRDNVFLGHDDVIMEEGMLINGNHASSAGGECDATCGPKEFVCSKSCSCIHIDLHCGKSFKSFINQQIKHFNLADGEIDCGPEGEDEEECEITEDMIKKIKSDCESNTLGSHVMCPNTFICIKQDWLCGNI